MKAYGHSRRDKLECGYIVDIFVRGDKFVVSFFNSES